MWKYSCGSYRFEEYIKRESLCECLSCKDHEMELPYIEEGSENKNDYREPEMKKTKFMLDIELSRDREEAMGVPLYLSSYSKIRIDQEASLRKEYDIGKEFELLFPGEKMLIHEVPSRYLTVYVAQLKVGLRFPLHTLFKDILKFWALQLGQLSPNGIRVIIGFIILCKMYGVDVN